MRCVSSRPGTFLSERGRSTPSGTGFLSPNAWAVPGWSGPHPAARNVPNIVRKEKERGMSELCPKDEVVILQPG